MKKIVSLLTEIYFAVFLFVLLVFLNLIFTPALFTESLSSLPGLMTPLIIAACATVPVILCGREGIDLSIGPLIGFINVILVKVLVLDFHITNPAIIITSAVLIGIVGAGINGILAIYIRIKPIVATLGTYLIFSGLSVKILPSPVGPAPKWLVSLSENLSLFPLLFVFVFWFFFRKLPLYNYMCAIGNDDRAAYAAGVNVNLVRFSAYIISGIFVAVAALSLTGLLGSADARIGPDYTLIAIASAALGGVSLAGGKGGVFGASIGALDIFLLQNLVTGFNASSFILQITYGLALVFAVVMGSSRFVEISDFFRLKLGFLSINNDIKKI